MPNSHRAEVASRPSAWHISVNPTGDRVVTFLAGHENGAGSDALCVRTVKDEFVRTFVVPIPGAPGREARWATLAWDEKGKNVALASLEAVHVWRVKRSGECVLRGSFLKLPDCRVTGIALVETPLCHFLFCLLGDGRLVRLSLPAGVNCGMYDFQTTVSSSLGSDWNPTCMTFHHAKKLFLIGGALSDGSFACALYSATSLSAADRVAKHQWSSWRQTSAAEAGPGIGCVSQVRFDASGKRALCGSSKGVALVTCDIENGPIVAPLTLPFVPTSFAWFDDEKLVVASYKLARLEMVPLADSSKSVSLSQQPMTCSQLTTVSKGRFFLLNCSHREYAATQITREKIAKLQKEAVRAATAWGSFVNSLHSYMTYFHLPTLNTRGGLTTRDEFHVTVYFDSFSPPLLVAKKMAAKKWEEALQVARRHALPTDDIFKARLSAQRQASGSSMEQNLGEIGDTQWVLDYCLNHVAADAEEAQRVLSFGLSKCSAAHERYRVLLEENLARLDTYLLATDGSFDGPDLMDFFKQDLSIAAIVHAMSGRVQVVKRLWQRHGRDLMPFRLAILDSFPVTLSCSLYAEMLPKCVDGRESDYNVREQPKRGSSQLLREAAEGKAEVNGWTPFLQSLLFPKERIRVLEGEYAPTDHPASLETISAWYERRILTVDDQSGQLSLCSELLSAAPPLPALAVRLDEVKVLVYKLHLELVSLREYAKKSPYDRCVLFLQALNSANVPLVLARVRQSFGGDHLAYLKRFVFENADSPVVELIFAQSAPAVAAEARPFLEMKDFMESVLEAAYASSKPDQVAVWRRVLRHVPSRLTHTGVRELEELHDRMDRLEAHLDACEMLARLGQTVAVSRVREVEFAEVVSKMRKHLLHKGGADWTGALRDMLALRHTLFEDTVPLEQVYCHYVACLIAAKQPLERVFRYAPDCGAEANTFVSEAASEVFDSCNGLDSPDLAYVRELLAQFPHEQLSRVVEAAEILGGAGAKMIPLQFRVWKNQTAEDVLARVCAAIVRQDAAASVPLSSEQCSRLCVLLGVADVARGTRALQVAFAESDLKRGRVSSALESSMKLEDAELALKCLSEGRQLSWSDYVKLAGLVLAKGKPEEVGRALQLMEEGRKKQPKTKSAFASPIAAVQHDPLLDDPLPKKKAPEPQKKKKKEEERQSVAQPEAEPDDIQTLAKKAWSNFFNN